MIQIIKPRIAIQTEEGYPGCCHKDCGMLCVQDCGVFEDGYFCKQFTPEAEAFLKMRHECTDVYWRNKLLKRKNGHINRDPKCLSAEHEDVVG